MLARSSLRSACSCVGRFSTAAAELACTSVSLPGPSTQPPKEPCPDCPSESLQSPPSYCSSSLPVLFAAHQGSAHRRTYTTQASSPKDNGSIFSSSDSPWDHVFKDIQDLSPFAPSPFACVITGLACRPRAN
ncbi:hypothetical protein A0H81_13504 [Grifola frondosa]|uniref:Uncharacterized protein n=1 Tax=Grifola frondosa TaxID=5627 RepID=A0A1C7LUQ4_GRIFR|nr:hypothetical protein A0H81_13504 [Grifola frondosa]